MASASYRDDSNKIVILNPKGGCGKTTLATNLASYFARRGPAPMLVDLDRRGYASKWLKRRPPTEPRVNGVRGVDLYPHLRRIWHFHIPRSSGAVIIDTPAALDQRAIRDLTRDADCLLVPILPSAFDVEVTTRFIAQLLLITDLDLPIGVIANRTRKNTRSIAMLRSVLDGIEIPTIAELRDAQTYVHAANNGLGICELPSRYVAREAEQFEHIIGWLDRLLMRTPEIGFVARMKTVSRTSRYDPPEAAYM